MNKLIKLVIQLIKLVVILVFLLGCSTQTAIEENTDVKVTKSPPPTAGMVLLVTAFSIAAGCMLAELD